MPFEFCFNVHVEGYWLIADGVVTFIFLMDVLVNFRTGVLSLPNARSKAFAGWTAEAQDNRNRVATVRSSQEDFNLQCVASGG